MDEPAVDGCGSGTDVFYRCDAAAGSSGAPVLSRVSNKVIALLHFGGCPDAGVRTDLIARKVRWRALGRSQLL